MTIQEEIKTRVFGALCNPSKDEVQTFNWALSADAMNWLYKMQNDAECQSIVWSIVKAVEPLIEEVK